MCGCDEHRMMKTEDLWFLVINGFLKKMEADVWLFVLLLAGFVFASEKQKIKNSCESNDGARCYLSAPPLSLSEAPVGKAEQ